MAPQYVDILNNIPATLCANRPVFSLTRLCRVAIVRTQIRETTAVQPDRVGSGSQPSASPGSPRQLDKTAMSARQVLTPRNRRFRRRQPPLQNKGGLFRFSSVPSLI